MEVPSQIKERKSKEVIYLINKLKMYEIQLDKMQFEKILEEFNARIKKTKIGEVQFSKTNCNYFWGIVYH